MSRAEDQSYAQALSKAHGIADSRTTAALATLLARGRRENRNDGDVLVAEGTPADALLFLVHGAVRVRQRDLNGRLRDLTTMPAPAVLGHTALIDETKRTASCIAAGRVAVVTLDRGVFREVLAAANDEGAALRRLLLKCLVRQLDRGNGLLRQAIAPPAARRAPQDVTVAELLRVAGALEGFHVSDEELAQMELVVPDEDDD